MWNLFQEVSCKLLVWNIILPCGYILPCANFYKNIYIANSSSSPNTHRNYVLFIFVVVKQSTLDMLNKYC